MEFPNTNQIVKKRKQLCRSLNDLPVYAVGITDSLGEYIQACYTVEVLAWGHIELEYYNLLICYEDELDKVKSVEIDRNRVIVTLDNGFVEFKIHRTYLNPCDKLYLCLN